jgi:hypothetical protein
MNGQSLGSVEFGQIFYFGVSNRGSDGNEIPGFVPAYYDVIDGTDGTVILEDQPLVRYTRAIWYGSVDTRDTQTDQAGPFEPNRSYAILVKATTTDGPETDPAQCLVFNFTVTPAYLAKIARLLGLSGENMLVDLFTYDDGGNATSFRVRLFSSKTTAEQATLNITDVPESGEIATYTVIQTFGGGRQFRQSSLNTIDVDAGDE